MPCKAFAKKKNLTRNYLVASLLSVSMLFLLSQGAEAVRRSIQMPVGVEKVEEITPEPEKPQQVKIRVPEPKSDSVWHAPAPQADRVAEDEAPAVDAALAAAPVVPVIDATSLVQLIFEPAQLITGEAQRLELDTLAQRMKDEPVLRIALNSYASPREGMLNEARRISLKRAMDVRNYLIGKGVAKERINVRALGDLATEEPKDRLDITPL